MFNDFGIVNETITRGLRLAPERDIVTLPRLGEVKIMTLQEAKRMQENNRRFFEEKLKAASEALDRIASRHSSRPASMPFDDLVKMAETRLNHF